MKDQNETIKLLLNEIEDQGILEAIGDGISIQDTTYRVVYQNKIHKRFVGEHIGEFCYNAYEKREHVCDGCPVAKAFQDGKTHTEERSAPTERGTSYFEITASVLKDTTGEALAGIEIVRDITVHKNAEENIRRRTEELAALLKVSQGLATTLDLDNVLQMTINEAVKLTGLGTGAIYLLEGERLQLWATTPPLPPKFPEELRFIPIADHPHIRQAITTRRPVIIDDTATADLTPAEQAVSKLRGLRTLLYVPLPVEDKVLGVFIVGSVEEPFVISEAMINLSLTLANQSALAIQNAQLYKNTQKAYKDLQESEDRYRRITDTITDYIYSVRVEGGRPLETKHSDTCFAVTGYTSEEFDNDPYLWIKIIIEKDHDLIRQQIEQINLGQLPKSVEHRIIRKDNVKCWVESTVVPHYDKDNNLISYDGIVKDITERKKAEKEQERLAAELKIKNKDLEQVLYVTSHDLRSPLVNIEGYSNELDYLLKEVMSSIEKVPVPSSIKEKITPIVKEDIPESLHYINISVSKMETLIKGILTLSRLGRVELKIEEIDMNEMMTDIVDNHSFRLKELGIKTEVSKLPNCKGDSSQINQVFSNILDNAVKYANSERSGVITISGYKDKNQSVYCIDDNGLGIAPEHQDKIFEIFHQLEPDRVKGEGMGLTIANRITEKHKGKIWVESELGKGSKFFVSLPS